MDIKRLKKNRASQEPDSQAAKPTAEKNFVIPRAGIGGSYLSYYDTLEEATEALEVGDRGIFKLVRRAKFSKVVEDVEG